MVCYGLPVPLLLESSPISHLLTDAIQGATCHLPFHHKTLDTGVYYMNPVPAAFVFIPCSLTGLVKDMGAAGSCAVLACCFFPCAVRGLHMRSVVWQAASAVSSPLSLLFQTKAQEPVRAVNVTECRQHRGANRLPC